MYKKLPSDGTRFFMTLSNKFSIERRTALFFGFSLAGVALGKNIYGSVDELERWIKSVADGSCTTPLSSFMNYVEIDRPIVINTFKSNVCFDFSGVRLLVVNSSTYSWKKYDAALSFFGNNFVAVGLDLSANFYFPQISGVRYVSGENGNFNSCCVRGFGWVGLSIGGAAVDCINTVVEKCISESCRFGFFVSGTKSLIQECYSTHFWSKLNEFPDGRWHPESRFYDGFVLSRGADATINSCRAIDCGQSGIYIGKFAGVRIIGGDYSYNANKGIDFGPATPGLVEDIIVDGAQCNNNITGNIHLFNVVGGVVTRCSVLDNNKTFALALDGKTRNVCYFDNIFSSNGLSVFVGRDVRNFFGT